MSVSNSKSTDRMKLGFIVRTFRWHVGLFLLLNAGLNVGNLASGGIWWAFWPLFASGFLLMLHYLGYKSLTVGGAWADERTQELNLKSYDRSHIEDLRLRHRSRG